MEPYTGIREVPRALIVNDWQYFELSVVSQWDNYEELHFMHHGAALHCALPARSWLDNQFPGRWNWRRGQ